MLCWIGNDQSMKMRETSRGLDKKLGVNNNQKQSKGANWEAKNRGIKGIVCHKITEKTGALVSVLSVKEDDEIFVATEQGNIIRLLASAIALSSRATTGSKAVTLAANDLAFVASLAPASAEEEEESSQE